MKVTLAVEGMSCGHCKAAVESGVGKKTGVASAVVNLEKKEVSIEYDPDVISLEELKTAIEDLGYDVLGS